jgi:hypothetical protein
MNIQNEKFVLSLCTKTWIRDSHGLFDYESNQTKNLNAVLAESIYIARRKHEIKTLNQMGDLKDEEELLFNVRHEDKDEYILENKVPVRIQPTEKNINDLSNKIWYVLKNDPIKSNNSNQTITNTNDDYYLCKNDVIKLGRVKYSLNEINIPSRQNNIDVAAPTNDPTKYDIDELNMNTEPVFDFIFEAKDSSEYEDIPDDERICKICYSEENDKENNPLVHLCNCNGGLRFSHFLCIKKWMETKLVIKENEKKTVKSYNIKSFNCEICKTPYPFKFKLKGIEKPFELIDLEKPLNSDYIVLESLNQMKENCNIKSIHVIQLTGEELTVGRGHESDVRINDISVSRSHAKLKYNLNDGTLLLRDLKSKFGTLILIKKPLKIKEKKIHLQIGRTYIEAWLMSMADFEKLRREKKQKHMKQHNQHNIQHNSQHTSNQGNVNNQGNNANNNMDIEDKNDGQNTQYPGAGQGF